MTVSQRRGSAVLNREVNNCYSRVVGRPKEFDPAEAVDRAMDVFWSQGYGATTPQQLADRLHIAKGSLYNAFGGKRQLYDLALARYLETRVHSVGAMLNAPGPAKVVLRQALLFLVRSDLEQPERRGCLATNSAVEFGRIDQDVTVRVLDFFARTEGAFRALLERGQREGDIRSELDAADTASMLLSAAIGWHVLARVESGPKRLLRAVDAAVALL
jgi:TetR/AcrR family transcriptional regulator, transcriptional repressor for nem operon